MPPIGQFTAAALAVLPFVCAVVDWSLVGVRVWGGVCVGCCWLLRLLPLALLLSRTYIARLNSQLQVQRASVLT